MSDSTEEALIGCLVRLCMIAVAVPIAFLTWWAWNASMPALFHLPPITDFWQAVALTLLANIIVPSSTHVIRR